MTKFGRATIFTTGLIVTDLFLITISALGCIKNSTAVSNAIGSMLVISTVVYIATIGPCSYTLIVRIPD